MAGSTGPIVAAGAITMGNIVLGNGQPLTSIIPTAVATSIAAVLLDLLSHASASLATGIAWIALITSLLLTPKSGNSAVTNLTRMTGL
jgi:2-phospho-L-lactate transferase/gluconeogenesis factor (CofD/UPF0052 family)